MKPLHRQIFSILFGGITIGVLFVHGNSFSPPADFGFQWWIFTGLITFTAIFGIPLGGGEVSILPMISLAAMMVMGPIPAAWASLTSSIAHGIYRYFWGQPNQVSESGRTLNLLGITAANITMHIFSILISGYFYRMLGGNTPITPPTNETIFALYGAGGFYLATNYLIASIFISLRGKGYLAHYIGHLPKLLLYELPPVFFAPLTAQIFTQLGIIQFYTFAIGLIVISFILRAMANSNTKLERRVKELGGLQAVGNKLSGSLDISVIAEAVYGEVKQLMPATNFYLALYDKETDEVSFPLAYEYDEKKHWQSRAAGNGLTEFILRTKLPLLIQSNVSEKLKELGIENIGREALSWLGVPIMAGQDALGVLAVQSHELPDSIPENFDTSHQEVLTTIAAQASAAIQNAHLFSQTDEELAQRVQELNSILTTTQEGILLVDEKLKVLAANRALADFLGVTRTAFLHQNLRLPDPNFPTPLIELIGFTPETLSLTLEKIVQDEDISRETILIDQENHRPVERVVTPVRGETGNINGWLFVFRDLTEEHQLAQLRDDLTQMLVHDLRSPIVNIRGSIDMIDTLLYTDDINELKEMLQITRRGSDQMLGMINELLDISKFESGAMMVNKNPAILFEIYQDVYERISPLAKQNDITIQADFPNNLPPVNCDAGLINRTIHNLLDNAIKFSPDGGIIQVQAKLDEDVGNSAVLMFSDDGEGIPKEFHNRIFKKYETVPTTAKRGRRGTGIGLYYCKLAVEAHQGQIWVESEPNQGSMFCFRLPANE